MRLSLGCEHWHGHSVVVLGNRRDGAGSARAAGRFVFHPVVRDRRAPRGRAGLGAAWPRPWSAVAGLGAASVLLTLLWFKVLRANVQGGPQWSAADALGEVGLLTSEVTPFQRGKVRFQKPLLGAEEWPCVADTRIEAGDRVRVTAVEGNLVRVGPASSS